MKAIFVVSVRFQFKEKKGRTFADCVQRWLVKTVGMTNSFIAMNANYHIASNVVIVRRCLFVIFTGIFEIITLIS